jgi:hypothetical protein
VEIDENTRGRKSFRLVQSPPKDNNCTSCVLMYYDMFSFGILLLRLLYSMEGRVTRKIRVSYFNDSNLDSISTCQIYNIYLLYSLGP